MEYLKNRGLTQETIKKFQLFDIKDYQDTQNYLIKRFKKNELIKAGLLGKKKEKTNKRSFLFYMHKLIIPFIKNEKIVFLQGRCFDNEKLKCKYLNVKDRKLCLFNSDILKGLKKSDIVYLCEGAFDTMRLAQENYNVIGIAGVKNFRDEWVSLFKGLNVILALDNDEAGKKATEDLIERFELKGILIKKIKKLPAGIKDINDYFLS